MQIQIITGYKFIELDQLSILASKLEALCAELALKGTILLSEEGININVCGTKEHIQLFKTALQQQDARFNDISFRESVSPTEIFRRLKVRVRDEIITFRKDEVNPATKQAPHITPAELKQWLDEERDFILLDTRNDFEVQMGTFNNALNLHLENFSEFPLAIEQLKADKFEIDKPVVMFCTGGIRCEKAALYMQNIGHKAVYQLQGGILNYFAKIGRAHYHGDCFVFDERVKV